MSGAVAKAVKLLPCPFCGSSNVDPEGWSTLPQYAKTPEERSGPACDDCEATAPSINMWNSRHNNSYADLVKALEEIDTLAVCTGVADPKQHANMLSNIARIARQALAKLASPSSERAGV